MHTHAVHAASWAILLVTSFVITAHNRILVMFLQVASIDTDPWRLASFGVLDLLKQLVEEQGVDVNAKDDREMSPIIWAIRSSAV